MAGQVVGRGVVEITAVLAGDLQLVAQQAGQAAGASMASGFSQASKGVDASAQQAAKAVVQGQARVVGSQKALAASSAALERASGSLAAAQKREADAAGAVRAAEAKLAEARASSSTKVSQIVAAEERLAAAQRAQTLAADGSVAAQRRLIAAQDGLAASSKAGAAAAAASGGVFARSSAAVAGFGKRAVASATENRQAWEQTGATMLKAGAVVGVGVGLAVKSFVDFDKVMSNVRAVSGATADQMDLLRTAAITAGRDTAFSATDAARAEAELAKVGISTSDVLKGGLTGALNLAAAGQIDLADAATISGQAMKIFNLAGSDVPRIADALAAGANKSAADVTQLSQALQQGGLVAAQTGLTMEDTVGTLSAFADNALIGSDAGTSLKTMLQNLNPTSLKAADLMDQLGLRAYDAQGNFVGIAKYAGQLKEGLKGLSVEQRNAALTTIFGSDAVRAANILYTQGAEGIGKYIAGVKDQGAAARVASVNMDNLAGDVEQLKGSLETAFIQGGSGANAGLRSLTQSVTGLVNIFGSLPPGLQQASVVMGGLATATLLAGGAMVSFVPKVVVANTAMRAATGGAVGLSTAMKTIGAGAAVVGVAAAANAASEYVGKAGVATVGTEKLSGALGMLAKNGSLGRDGLALMSVGMGPFRRDADSTSEALDRFGQAAEGALGQGLNQKLGRLQDGGAKVAAFKAQAQQLDAALAAMAAGGHADEAKAAFQRLADAAVNAGLPLTVITKQFPQYAAAAQAAATATDKAKTAVAAVTPQAKALKDAEASLTKQSTALAQQQDQLTGAMAASNNQFLTNRGSARSYYDALDAATAAVKTNGRSLDVHTAKGRQNQAALDGAASASLDYLTALYKQTGPGAQFDKVLGSTRKNLETAAQRFGMSKTAARNYADQVLAVPAQAATTVTTPGLEAARAKIESLTTSIQNINGKTVTVRVNGDGSVLRTVQSGNSTRSIIQRARGGLIPGPASTADTVPAMLSTGEFVVRASETARHLGLLKAINSGRVAGFARGGVVGRDVRVNTSTDIDPSAVTRTVNAAVEAFANAAASQAKSAAAAAAASGNVAVGGAPSNPTGNQAIVKNMAASMYGWAGAQWNALYRLVMGESGFRNTAQNPTSTAYGMFQFLNGTWRDYGVGKTSDPGQQTVAGLRYIARNYGTPMGALSKWMSRSPHWYDAGGVATGKGLMAKNTIAPERVLSPQQTAAFDRLVDSLSKQGGVNGVRTAVTVGVDTSAFRGAGTSAGEGFSAGILSMRKPIDAAAAGLASTSLDAARRELGIASPSKAFLQVGKDSGAGFVQGLRGSREDLQTVMNTLINDLFRNSNPKLAKATLALRGTLLSMFDKRAGLQQRVADQKAAMTDLVKSMDDFKTQLRDSLVTNGSVTGQDSFTFRGITDGMRKAVDDARGLNSVITRLKSAGLNQTSLGQIVAAGGTDSGLRTANLILSQRDGVKQVNALQAQLGKAAGDAASNAAGGMYGAGVQAGWGLLKGLQSQEKALSDQMVRMGASLVASIRKALGIKSPSRVFAAVGEQTVAGFIAGVDRRHGDAQSALAAMASVVPVQRQVGRQALVSSLGRLRTSDAAPAAPAASQGVTINGDVHTQDPDEFARLVSRRQRDMIATLGIAQIASGG